MSNEYRLTLTAIEAFDVGAPAAQVTTLAAETFNSGAPAARVTLIGTETLHVGAPAARVAWVGVEVFRSIADVLAPIALPHQGLNRFRLDEEEPWIFAPRRIGAVPAPRRRPVLFTVC